MAGVEVAGLVLGAIPLVISALEHYQEGLGKVKAFYRWQDQLDEAIRCLLINYTSYELSIRVLFSSIMSQEELETMMSDADSHLWTDPSLEAQLRERLSSAHAYVPYLQTVTDIEKTIGEIAASLSLDRAGQVTRNELHAIVVANPKSNLASGARGYQFSKRIKFTLSKSKVKKLLSRLEQNVDRLDKFNDKTEKLEPYKSSRKSRFTVSPMRIQQYASSLHRILNRIWLSSAHSHFATNLLLEPRVTSSKQKAAAIGNIRDHEDGAARFVFQFSDPCLQWTHCEIQVTEGEDRLKTSSRVTIAVSPPSPATQHASYDGFSESSEVTEITNMCATLQSAHMSSGHPRFRFDHNEGKLKGIYASSLQSIPSGSDFVSLSDLIGATNVEGSQRKLTKEDGYILAVTLVSSLLQLHSTPWIGKRWSKSNITFPQWSNQATESQKPHTQISFPYITHQCSSQTCEYHGCNSSHITTDDDSCKLLDLGILLLEIYFNRDFESFYQDPDAPAFRNELTDLGVIKRWMTQEKGNLSWAFQNAVAHCLRCFADPNANLQDSDFRQAFIDQVLLPLQDELSMWTDGPTKS